jgi:6-pyruvoyl-tetrahydropterin synthase
LNYYQIELSCPTLSFSASHFLVTQDFKETIHEHVYRIFFRGTKGVLTDGMAFNFLPLHDLLAGSYAGLCNKLLLPEKNRLLLLEYSPDGHFVKFYLEGRPSKPYPTNEVLVLPYENVSAERLAYHLALEINNCLSNQFDFAFDLMELKIEEAPHCYASYILCNESNSWQDRK